MTPQTINDAHAIKFSQDWNKKLNCYYFTTIRLYNPAKFTIGKKYFIYCKNELAYTAEVVTVKHCLLNELTEFECYQDTGYSRADTIALLKKMYKDVNFTTHKISIILLKQLER